MKKIIAMLLAFYVLVLVFAPCVDDDFSLGQASKPVVSAGMAPTHQDHPDCCTPFCTCSCCSAPFEVLKNNSMPENYFLQGTMSFFFYSQLRTRYDFSIWEPPKA